MSARFQITLPENLLADIKRAAARRKLSTAEFIRQAIAEKLRTSRKDPFASITGVADSHETRLSSQIDKILYREP